MMRDRFANNKYIAVVPPAIPNKLTTTSTIILLIWTFGLYVASKAEKLPKSFLSVVKGSPIELSFSFRRNQWAALQSYTNET